MLIPALAALIPLLPFAGWAANGVWGSRLGPRGVAVVACGAVGAAFAAAALLLWQVRTVPGAAYHVDLYPWLVAGSVRIPLPSRGAPLSFAVAPGAAGGGVATCRYSCWRR